MHPPTRTRVLGALLLAPMLANLSGCLAYEIRNELRQTNASLEEMKLRLNTVNDTLLKLERTNTLISDVDMRLETLEATNATLSGIEAHLAAIRRGMGAMGTDEPQSPPQEDPGDDQPQQESSDQPG